MKKHRVDGKVSMVHLGALAVLLSVVLGHQESKHKIQPESSVFNILIHSQRCCCSAGYRLRDTRMYDISLQSSLNL